MSLYPYTIIASIWFHNTNRQGDEFSTIGVVAIESFVSTEHAMQWKAYIGLARGESDASKQNIAARGEKLSPEQAHGFFPQFPIEQYGI